MALLLYSKWISPKRSHTTTAALKIYVLILPFKPKYIQYIQIITGFVGICHYVTRSLFRNKHWYSRIRQKQREETLEIRQLLETEMAQLQNILERAPLTKVDILFNDKFPKDCSTCGEHFSNRSEYLEKTTQASAGSLLFSEYGLQEFRNCKCGTTMSMWGPDDDRRDITHEGALKRAIFTNCMDKLLANGLGTRELLVKSLRKLFENESLKAS